MVVNVIVLIIWGVYTVALTVVLLMILGFLRFMFSEQKSAQQQEAEKRQALLQALKPKQEGRDM